MKTTVETFCKLILASRAARAIAFGLLWTLGLAQTSVAQTLPLNFSKNYILSGGDYVVGGVGLRGAGDATGFATGRISIPDTVQASATGVASPEVPAGASIVAAFLYWESVEKSKSQFAGQNGFFGPINFNNDGTVNSVTSHPITGTVLGNPNAPSSWSAGGCAGSSGGTTTLRTYRADVRPFLPLDANGNIAAGNKLAPTSYQVSLADSGSNGGGAPLTLGATLVLIYRVAGGGPMTAIILYDGAFAPSNQNSTMTQPIQGFYQPASSPAAKITHIVGDGQTNKAEQVFFNNNLLTTPYTGNPPFPGVYNSSGQLFNGSWDNTTFDVSLYVNASVPPFPNVTTSVVPGSTTTSGSGGGCVDWGTIIFSTTVQSTDQDSLLDVWKKNQGYCDAAVNPGTANEGVCANGDNSWVPLPGAATPGKGFRDLYVQIDHFDTDDFIKTGGTSGHSHKLKQAALDMVGDLFASHQIALHVDCNNCYPGDKYVINSVRGGDVIPESSATCQDNPKATPPVVCEFPGVAVTRWKGDFTLLKNQPLNYPDELSCDTRTLPGGLPGAGPPCVRRFQHGRKDSYHEVILGHSFGLAANTWFIADGTLVSLTVSGGIATATTSTPHGLSSGARVTVSGAILTVPGLPSLAGPFDQAFALNANYLSITMTSPTTFTFPVTNVPAGNYNNPTLFVASGAPLSVSGWSDLPGADSLITFGGWPSDIPADDKVGSVLQQAGTFLHEVGHTLGLQHGGGDGFNCKPNYLSVMSYVNQVRGVPGFDGIPYVDLSGQHLPDLDEVNLSESAGLGTDGGKLPTYRTRWYAPLTNNFLYNQLNIVAPVAAAVHCDGTPIMDDAKMVRLEGPLVPGAIDWSNNGTTADTGVAQDINFDNNSFNTGDGTFDPAFAGFNDWGNLDLRQIGGAPGVFAFSADDWNTLENSGSGGTGRLGGTGGVTGGMIAEGDGGTGRLGGTGGTGRLGGTGGTGRLGGTGGVESDFDLANSTVDPPTSVTATQVSKSVLVTGKSPGFGRIRTYYLWRANVTNGPISPTNLPVNIAKVTGTPATPSLTDNFNLKNKNTYAYFITSALAPPSGKTVGAQSGPSNIVTITVVF